MTPLEHMLSDFTSGTAARAQALLGAHPATVAGQEGYTFRVWAPRAASVSVMGDFNGWDPEQAPMELLTDGIWEGFVPGLARYDAYKFAVHTADGRILAKADPYAFHAETRPGTASKLYDLSGYAWGDKAWLSDRANHPVYHSPLNIYELHLGSWRRTGDDGFLSYREIAQYLVPYAKEMGYTHVEFMPITEHPLDASWGYQCTGYFAATSRFGTPDDLKYLVDELHQAGVGVLLDWVPAHFPKDAFGLYEFDGTPTYEYGDPRKWEHAGWGTRVFDYGRNEVRSFLYSSALFWLEEYHLDGLRVDAVASMLYLDYDREAGQWCPNIYGGHENLEAVDFFQRLNEHIFAAVPDALMIAEESTSWPQVTRPTYGGGLGFNLKWNMGWMNDSLRYVKQDPYFRQYHHRDITFSLAYAFSENFVLSISHDEVVHGKSALFSKMPGDAAMKAAGVRGFYGYMLTHPGKKLMMMGSEFGQENEWNFEHSLDWHLLNDPIHQKLHDFFKDANQFYLDQSPLWDLDFTWEGFQWLCGDDYAGNCVGFLRRDGKGKTLVVLCNFSPVHREGYRLGVPASGRYEVVFNTDEARWGGGGLGDHAPLQTADHPIHGQAQSLAIDLPPMSTVILQCTNECPPEKAKK